MIADRLWRPIFWSHLQEMITNQKFTFAGYRYCCRTWVILSELIWSTVRDEVAFLEPDSWRSFGAIVGEKRSLYWVLGLISVLECTDKLVFEKVETWKRVNASRRLLQVETVFCWSSEQFQGMLIGFYNHKLIIKRYNNFQMRIFKILSPGVV